MVLTSDETWRASRTQFTDWEKPVFNDAGWESSVKLPNSPCGGLIHNFEFHPVWAKEPKSRETIYLRKTFVLQDAPTSVLVKAYFDDDGEVYINGARVIDDTNGAAGFSQGYYASYFKKGENTIALMAKDVSGLCQSASIYVDIKTPKRENYRLLVPLIKQSNISWFNKTYAGGSRDNMYCGTHIGECGCATTSLAMLLNFHGVTKDLEGNKITPDTLNEYLVRNQSCNEHGCVSDGYVYGDVVWGAIHKYTKLANDRFKSPKVMFVGGGPYNKEQVRADIIDNKPVILKAPGTSHWFVASGIDGDTFTIRDPLYEWDTLDNIEYNNTSSYMRRFSKVNSDFSAIEIFIKEPGHIVLVAPDGKKYGYKEEGLYADEDGVRHLIVQTPPKGSYEIKVLVPSPKSTEYVVVKTNRSAENSMNVENTGVEGAAMRFSYDPDFVLPTPTLVPTQIPTPNPTGNEIKGLFCRGGENRTPTARTPCAHSTIILLPVSRLPFLAPACYDVFRFDDGYNLRQSSLFFTSDYFIIN